MFKTADDLIHTADGRWKPVNKPKRPYRTSAEPVIGTAWRCDRIPPKSAETF
jgi:hypothetical protein